MINFNSRPSARGDVETKRKNAEGIAISIHAPPRGATEMTDPDGESYEFQFTPLREGRPHDGRESCRAEYFNSRPSARGDFKFRKEKNNEYISIHAPPRGATAVVLMTHSADLISIHAPPRGATLAHGWYDIAVNDFNSRPSARGDLRPRCRCCYRRLFQFTPLREGRPQLGSPFSSPPISIHAPPRGATTPQHRKEEAHEISIHAPPRGATW